MIGMCSEFVLIILNEYADFGVKADRYSNDYFWLFVCNCWRH